MSLVYKRYPPPREGETLLMGFHQIWKDPRKEVPLPLLESQKGMEMPSWTQLAIGTTVTFALAAFQHARLLGRW